MDSKIYYKNMVREFIKNTFLKLVRENGIDFAIEEVNKRGATEDELKELKDGLNSEFLKN